jgi:membrane fusion protein, multidrug efflux system
VAEAKLQLEDSTLRAPFDGVIAQRFVDEGQSITVNKPVIRLQSVGSVDIIVDVPETVLTSDICSPGIVGMVAEISGMPGRQYPVRVKEIEQVLDEKTRRFPVRYEVLHPSGVTALPGMTATVSVSFRRPRLGGSCLLTADLHSRRAVQGP